jgi:chemosensory pili system protein ChpA (sensor histidine kinase/response regulator)
MTPQVEGVEDDPLVDRFAEPLPGPPGDVDVLCSADEFLGADGHQRTQGADLLDRLVDIAWETSRCGARLDQANGRLGLALDALEQTVNRLRDQWRLLDLETQGLVRGVQEDSGEDRAARADLEPDRLSTIQALSRPLNETVGDLTSLQGLLAGHQREAAGLLTRQVRLIDALKDGLERTRMAGTP